MKTILRLNKQEVKALDKVIKWLYKQAKEWRGYYARHEQYAVLQRYDLHLREARSVRQVLKAALKD